MSDNLFEVLRQVNGKWALVSRKTNRPLVYFDGEGKPSDDWIAKQERRIQYFKSKTESVDLFIGRFQPFTVAHQKLVSEAQNVVVAVVKGVKSSQDKYMNPFDFNSQAYMIEKCVPGALVIEVTSGYVPDIIAQLAEFGLAVRRVIAGEDRVNDYERQLTRHNSLNETQLTVDMLSVPRSTMGVSATKVRNALRNDCFEEFVTLVPEELHGDYEEMKQVVNEEPTNTIGGGQIAPHPKPMVGMMARKYRDFLDQLQKKTKTKYDNAEEER